MNTLGDKCDHGKKWGEDCPECDAVWIDRVTMPDTKRRIQRMVSFCDKNPGVVERASVATMRDLYVLIGQLLTRIDSIERQAREDHVATRKAKRG